MPSLRQPALVAAPALLLVAAAAAQEPDSLDPAPEFTLGGQYRIMANVADFGFHQATLGPNEGTNSFVNQRFRTWFGLRRGPEVEAYLQLEMGHQTWGDNFEWTKTYAGPRHPAATDPNGDRVGMEVRRAWIAYHPSQGRLWRVGIQDWQDSFHQTLASSDWDFQAGGVAYRSESGDSIWSLGGYSLWEGNAGSSDDAALLAFDWDSASSAGQGFGFSAYYLNDRGGYSYPTFGPYDNS
ncbi:MAG: hypothetical protein D6702_03555 [Planctomycetota bacterium]|nr:MAG: hypothetical protein D6702_03555 [Planctomycetota bacterium]